MFRTFLFLVAITLALAGHASAQGPIVRYDDRGQTITIDNMGAEMLAGCTAANETGLITRVIFVRGRITEFRIKTKAGATTATLPVEFYSQLQAGDAPRVANLVRRNTRVTVFGYRCGASGAIFEANSISRNR